MVVTLTNTSGGDINFASIPLAAGNYDVRINAQYYLPKKHPITLTNDFTMNFPVLLAGDLNDDNVINTSDWTVIAANWFTSSVVADINGDGLVNTIDWSIMDENWLQAGE